MEYAIVETIDYQGQTVRCAFDHDETYIFIEDAGKLHYDFSEKFLRERMDPEDVKTIVVKGPNADPQEHLVVSIEESRLFSFASHWETTDTYWELYLWLHDVMTTNYEYRKFLKDNAERYRDKEFRLKHLDHAYKFRNFAETMVLKEQFFIDTLSKSADDETTFEFLNPGMGNTKQEAPNEASIA